MRRSWFVLVLILIACAVSLLTIISRPSQVAEADRNGASSDAEKSSSSSLGPTGEASGLAATPAVVTTPATEDGGPKTPKQVADAAANAVLQRVEKLASAEAAMNAGRYELAVERLADAGLRTTEDFVGLIDAAFAQNARGVRGNSQQLTDLANWGATALALGGQPQAAAEVFRVALDRVARTRRYNDLQIKLSMSPGDASIAEKMDGLLSPATEPNVPVEFHGSETYVTSVERQAEPNGPRSYLALCANCHGANGDGFGPASRHLDPPPRNFCREPMRIVSAENQLATDDDLRRTILRGLGGGAMPAFPELSSAEVDDLVAQVRRFQRDGLAEQFADAVHNSRTGESETNQVDVPDAATLSNDGVTVEQWIERRLRPSAVVSLPDSAGPLQLTTRETAEALFVSSGCGSCHAVSSIDTLADGNRSLALFDSLGRPIQARRLEHDEFRGGNDAESIYRRLKLGIPGTPHPALSGADEQALLQLVSLVMELNQVTQHVEP